MRAVTFVITGAGFAGPRRFRAADFVLADWAEHPVHQAVADRPA